MGKQDDHVGVVAEPHSPHIEVVTKSVDVWLPAGGGCRQGITTRRSTSESLQVLHFMAVEPAAVIAHVLDPSELLLAKGHRVTGLGYPPIDEGALQSAMLLVEVIRPAVWITFVTHPYSFPQNQHGGAVENRPPERWKTEDRSARRAWPPVSQVQRSPVLSLSLRDTNLGSAAGCPPSRGLPALELSMNHLVP